MWEIRDFSKFGNKTPIQIHVVKNHLIRNNICREIKEKNQEKKIKREEKEFDKISKN